MADMDAAPSRAASTTGSTKNGTGRGMVTEALEVGLFFEDDFVAECVLRLLDGAEWDRLEETVRVSVRGFLRT